MPKAERCKAFLITVVERHAGPRTYAVVKPTSAEALDAVRILSLEGTEPFLAGSLSRDVTRRLKLKRDDVLAI